MTRLAAAVCAAGTAWGASAPAVDGDLPGTPEVERLSDTKLQIRWSEDFASGPVRVYAGQSPDRIDRSAAIAVAEDTVTLRAPRGADGLGLENRLYFELVPESGGHAARTAERRLPLKGADNFRDLGGYLTREGRRVRWGRLYRSDDLSSLTASDLKYLSRIGVRLVCDFRTERERESKPDKLVASEDVALLGFPIEQEGVDPVEIRNKILTGGITRLGMEHTMRAAYRAFVEEHAGVWAELLRRLADPSSLPTLVHCTAGKDRTGFAAALVLLTLGVPRETVFEDYLLSNRYREDTIRTLTRWAPIVSLFRTRAEDLLPLLEVRAGYLQTSLDAMEEGYGSVDGFLTQALGVDADLREALAANLLR